MDFLKPSVEILKQFLVDPQKNLKLVLSNELDKLPLDASSPHANHHAITRVVYNVVRNFALIDFVIRQYSSRRIDKMQPDIRLLLEIGTSLLLFSESTPDYAVINECVNFSSKNAKGFVNAILRNIARNKAELQESFKRVPRTYPLDVLYSTPNILVENLKRISALGANSPHPLTLEDYLTYLNREPVFHLRANTRDFSYEDVQRFLTEENIHFSLLEKFQSFEIKETGRAVQLMQEKKQFFFQNIASQVVSIITSRYAKHSVLDCCSAPGTKSATLALLNPELRIYSNDVNPKRVRLIQDFVNDFGFTSIHPIVSDAKCPGIKIVSPEADGSSRTSSVDFIILDAPCSSAGTLRKNPDLKMKIDEKTIQWNAKNQYSILESLLSLVRQANPSPYILYSVCSFTKEETDDIIERTLDNFRSRYGEEIENIDLTPILAILGFRYLKSRFGYYLQPSDVLNNDLFYFTLLRKN